MMYKVEDTVNQIQSFEMLPSTSTPNFFDQNIFYFSIYMNKPKILSMVHINK